MIKRNHGITIYEDEQGKHIITISKKDKDDYRYFSVKPKLSTSDSKTKYYAYDYNPTSEKACLSFTSPDNIILFNKLFKKACE